MVSDISIGMGKYIQDCIPAVEHFFCTICFIEYQLNMKHVCF
jgi:hypothetical protein